MSQTGTGCGPTAGLKGELGERPFRRPAWQVLPSPDVPGKSQKEGEDLKGVEGRASERLVLNGLGGTSPSG